MKTGLLYASLIVAGCSGEDGRDGVDGADGTNATVTAGDGLSRTGDTFSVDSTVVRQSTAGDVTITGAYKYMPPKQHTLTVPTMAFVPKFPGSSLADYLNGGALSVGLTGPGNETLLAAVNLPQDAKVKSMTCRFRDDDAAANFSSTTAIMYSGTVSDGVVTPELNLPVTTTGTPGISSPTANAATLVVNNATKFYFINVLYSLSAAPTSNTSLLFMGCQIVYDVDGPG